MQIQDLLQLKIFSKDIVSSLQKNSVIMLRGELGVGKTTLMSFILEEIIKSQNDFTSPTFTIVNEYFSEILQSKIFHMDLYRIRNTYELNEIGFTDMLNNGITFIEWPEIAFSILQNIKESRLTMINLEFQNENIRIVTTIHPCNIQNMQLQYE